MDQDKPECRVEDCALLAESVEVPLCRGHAQRRRNTEHLVEQYVERCKTIGALRFDFTGIHPQVQLELQYVLQCKVDEQKSKAPPQLFSPLLNELRTMPEVRSLLSRSADEWMVGMGRLVPAYCSLNGLVRYAIRCLEDLQAGDGWDNEYPRDVWQLRRLHLARERGNVTGNLDFSCIAQGWLRELAKRYVRLRLSAGISVTLVQRNHNAIQMLSDFLGRCAPGSLSAAVLERDLLERWLADIAQHHPMHARSRAAIIGGMRGFLDAVRLNGWAPMLPQRAQLHSSDFPRLPAMAPRSLSEHVMSQLETQTNLARFRNPLFGLITQIIIGTGLRQSDARKVPFDCLIRDEQNAPYLRYFNHKMRREAVVPIDEGLAGRISEQQQVVAARFDRPAVLIPRSNANLGGELTLAASSYNNALNTWLTDCDIRDELGRPARVTPHQFRHTYATRLINLDVPLEVVRRLLDHSSMQMTAHYARLNGRTIRAQWEKARKVDISGREVHLDQDSPLADAAWMKHNLSRAKMALPNGYCGLPLQQSCPHANACLDCPVFITTPEFLTEHRQQLIATNRLIATANADGRFRLAEMNQRVAANLERIITSLEQPKQGPPDAS